jgi:hypothetical protein
VVEIGTVGPRALHARIALRDDARGAKAARCASTLLARSPSRTVRTE